MGDTRTREELKRRLDELSEQYLKRRNKEIQKDILEVLRRLGEPRDND